MKKALNSILAALLAIVMTASTVASEISYIPDLLTVNDTEITAQKDEGNEPDCGINCDESWLDDVDGDY